MRTKTCLRAARDGFPSLLVSVLMVWSTPTLSQEWWDIQPFLSTTPMQATNHRAVYSDQGGHHCFVGSISKPVNQGILRVGVPPDVRASRACARGDGERGHAGLELESISQFEARGMRVPRIGGARVKSVHAGGPAATAGLSSGDVIIGLDGTDIGNGGQLQLLIRKSEPGQSVALSVFRDGKVRSIPIVLTVDGASEL